MGPVGRDGRQGRLARCSGGIGSRPSGARRIKVDSDKLAGTLEADGYLAATDPASADLVVVNTCAFIEAARQESIDTVLALSDRRRQGSRLVVTGCMAERYGAELADALPEVDLVAGFGVPVHAQGQGGRSFLRSAEPAPAQGGGPLGVRQGGRGV